MFRFTNTVRIDNKNKIQFGKTKIELCFCSDTSHSNIYCAISFIVNVPK